VSAGTALNPSKERSPTKRAKSTVVGALKTCTGLLPVPFRAMLFIVMLKDSTEGNGASSLVTKTADGLLPPPPNPLLDPPPQATKVSAVSASNEIDKSRFMKNSWYRILASERNHWVREWEPNQFMEVSQPSDRLRKYSLAGLWLGLD
jgi:hypothetical protein